MKPPYKYGIIFLILSCFCLDSSGAAASKRWKITSVRFENNHVFRDTHLHRLIVSQPSKFLNPSYYHSEILQDDLRNLELYYRQHGYLEARMHHVQVSLDSVRKRVEISIMIEEGDQTVFESISVFNNHAFSDDALIQKADIKTGETLRQKKIESAITSLLSHYADHGYLESEINPELRVDTTTHRAILDFYVWEGIQYQVGDIHLSGLQRTRPEVVRRELNFTEGEIIRYSNLLMSQRKIYLTGLFQNVFIRPLESSGFDSTKRDIRIQITEKLSSEFNISIGYGSVDKLRGKAEFLSNNIRGKAQKVGLATSVSFVQQTLNCTFTEPWTFKTPWRTDLRLFLEHLKEPGYELGQLGAHLTIGRKLTERSNLLLTYREEHNRLSRTPTFYKYRDIRPRIRSLKVVMNFDTRDNLFNATRGSYIEVSSEFGGSFTGTISGFFRLNILFKTFSRLSKTTSIGTSIGVGWIDVNGGLEALPLHERFYTGGPNSIRGFRYQRVGPLNDEGIPTGGRFKLVWNVVEIRRRIFKMVSAAVFLDAGNVWSKPEQFSVKQLRVSPGLGIRFDSPIGVARLDVGWNPLQKKDESVIRVVFGMGHVF